MKKAPGRFFSTPKGAGWAELERSLVVCISCSALCLPCHQEMSAVLCLSFTWATSSHYFPLNSCLSSTVVWWDGDSHHYMHHKYSVMSQYLCELAHWHLCFGESALLKSPGCNSSQRVQISKTGRWVVCHYHTGWRFGPWITHHHSASHTKYLVSNYLCAFLSSFSMPPRSDSNNYSAFINLLDSSADAWSHLLFIWLV